MYYTSRTPRPRTSCIHSNNVLLRTPRAFSPCRHLLLEPQRPVLATQTQLYHPESIVGHANRQLSLVICPRELSHNVFEDVLGVWHEELAGARDDQRHLLQAKLSQRPLHAPFGGAV